MKDYARSFYKGKAWKNTQSAYMISQHYICQRCGNVARIVHHVKYITPQNINDPNITLNWDNLEALCIDCHNREHMGSDACAEGLSFNSNGELIYTPGKVNNDCGLGTDGGRFQFPSKSFHIRGGAKIE